MKARHEILRVCGKRCPDVERNLMLAPRKMQHADLETRQSVSGIALDHSLVVTQRLIRQADLEVRGGQQAGSDLVVGKLREELLQALDRRVIALCAYEVHQLFQLLPG